jgi:hypothetical protein
MIRSLSLCLTALLLCCMLPAMAQKPVISGEAKTWHNLILTFDGPPATERDQPNNPFTSYRLDVTFSQAGGAITYVVPGYYAADGKAGETSATAGNKWRVHFAPDKPGRWNYAVSFKKGRHIAVRAGGESAGYMDGATGTIQVSKTDKKLPDNRARGRLQYVGERYLKWAGTNEYFIKVGTDAPENMLHYADFDGTTDGYGKVGKDYKQFLKTWAPHARDYTADADAYTWQGGKGKNLLGAINYLAGKGVNALSFLTFSVDGDDGCVSPYLSKKDDADFVAQSQQGKGWSEGLFHWRFDCSKLDQWEKIFAYADQKGMFLHFKTFENEGNTLMGADTLSEERKLYYRELIARFGHHLALNWNLSEEATMSNALVNATTAYIKSIDPYHHHLVIHTFPKGYHPDRKDWYEYHYPQYLGPQSALTGPSLQLQKKDTHTEVKRWIEASAAAGKPWAVANDEQGTAADGVAADADYAGQKGKVPDNAAEIRHKVLWATLMAGGWGVEYYFGYQTGETDLTLQDFRSRDRKWNEARYAHDFFVNYLPFWQMKSMDELTADPDDFVLGKDGQVYAVYLPKGGALTLPVSARNWQIRWFNPRTGAELTKPVAFSGTAQAADTNDWVALINRK